jgi:hypothetical protein
MTSARSSRPSFLSGTFEVVKYAEFLSKEYSKALAKSINEVTKEQTNELRKKAKESSTAWARIASDLESRYNEKTGSFEFGIMDQRTISSKIATDLEYGVPRQNAPQPLLRAHAVSAQKQLGDRIANKVHAKLKEKYQ